MTILVIIEQPLCREVMTDVAQAATGSDAVQAVGDLEEGLSILRASPVSLVVVSQSTASLEEGGLSKLVQAAGAAPVVTMDMRYDTAAARRAATAGARGYIPMTDTRELISAAIGVVAAGGVYFSQSPLASPPVPAGPVGRSSARRLSRRQVQVLDQLLLGRTNREIADALGISLPTVKLHVHAILAITGARNRTEAALLAREGWMADAD